MKISLNKISKQDTLFLKGIAIAGMLMWHIFYCPNPEGITYSPIIQYIGTIGDVCVSIFLFISGYGLTLGYKKVGETNPITFILNRLLKFYCNFWFVFILIVSFGTFIMHQPILTEGSNLERILQLVKEFLAIRGQSSYNDSWWYFSLIISLYLIFPLLYWGTKKVPWIMILFLIFNSSFSLHFINQDIHYYMPIFVVGILWAMYGGKIPSISIKKVVILLIITIIPSLALLASIYLSIYSNSICKVGIPLYAILTIAITILVVSLQYSTNIVKRLFCYLGTYATNIYIIHLMFSKYWFSDTFYSIKSPWLLFIALLISSLIFSIAIEYVKTKSGYNVIFNKLITKIK